jgi:ATP-binding cassette subfamily F protein uup
VVELDRGHLSDWKCDYDTFLVRKEEFLHAEELAWKDLDRKLKKEEAWVRQGVKARRTRSVGRIHALYALRAERKARRERQGSVNLSIQESARSGQLVLKAENVHFNYDEQAGAAPFNFLLSRGDKVGILGPNGCGKTTCSACCWRRATGRTQARHRPHRARHQLAGGLFRPVARPAGRKKTLIENIASERDFVEINGTRRHVIGYLQDFLFEPDRSRQRVATLSGGERNRLLLARLFAQPSNVLVLDEPTNDLDLDTLELLEEQWTPTRAPCCWSATIAPSSTTWSPACSPSKNTNAERGGAWLGPEDGWFVNEYVGGYDDWAASANQRRPRSRTKRSPPPPAAQARQKTHLRKRTPRTGIPARPHRGPGIRAARTARADGRSVLLQRRAGRDRRRPPALNATRKATATP